MDTAITIARELIDEIGVEEAWQHILREGGHREMLVEVSRWRRWVRRRERRGASLYPNGAADWSATRHPSRFGLYWRGHRQMLVETR